MGTHDRSEALFYYFRLEDQVPETHLLPLIDKYISFEFVRQQLKDSYSETGQPSIDPELSLRMIGYLYGGHSDRNHSNPWTSPTVVPVLITSPTSPNLIGRGSAVKARQIRTMRS